MKKFFIIGLTIILSLMLINTKSFAQGTTTSKPNCYRCHTSLGEDLNAYIMLSVKDFTKYFDYDSKYYEIVLGKVNLYTDGVKLKNGLEPPKDEIYVSGVSETLEFNESLEFIPVLISNKLINKIKIGSIVRPSDRRICDNERYYVIGYIENGNADGLYEFTDYDLDLNFYGTLGRSAHFYEFELIQYRERK